MTRARVFVIDDSAVIRRVLSDVLGADPGIEVVGTAGTAAIALTKLAELEPDVITLDVEMPGTSGLDLLLDIRKRWRSLPVIMFSALTQRAAATTLEALARGATDYVTKPASTGSREASVEHVRTQLVPKIKALAFRGSRRLPERGLARPATTRASRAVDVVAVASSTGGPNALVDVLKGLGGPLPVPMVIVQHMPAMFTRILADRLAATSRLRVLEAAHGAVLEPGTVYLAPGDHHLKLVREHGVVRAHLDQSPPESSCRPAADVTLRSVAAAYGGHALVVVLTGMGQDGLRGVELLRGLGAQVVVQDEASSVVWGMPGIIATAGLADEIIPLTEIPRAIVQRLRESTQRHSHAS